MRRSHAVQLYEDPRFLADRLAEFVGAGLGAGEEVVVIATAAHRDALCSRLRERAFDVERAREGGQLVLLDAEETVAKLLVDGMPTHERFEAVVVPLLEILPRTRAYGEMVDVLFRTGRAEAALRLEQLWSDGIADRDVQLLCGYALTSFATDPARFPDVCAAHSRVYPAEGYSALAGEDARAREVATLQLRARRLEEELERRAALERALGEKQEELSAFLESAAVAIHFVGPDGVILWANTAELAMLGYRADEYVGRHITEFSVDHAPIEEEIARLASGGELRGFESRMRCKDGSIRHVIADSNSVFRDGKLLHSRCFMRDVTDMRHVEEDLRTALAELDSAARMKDEFLATVSHELRTPLNAILGWVRMLRAGGLPEDKSARALETIERNAIAQTQLIEDLLDVSRIISGKLRLEIGAVDVAAVVENAIEAVRPSANAKHVHLERAIDPDAGPIQGDAERLQQVVWNLLTNAVKFTPPDGRVDVVVSRQAESVEIQVTDTGQGIPVEFVPHVFERFRQADGTSTRKHNGLGLGLAIVRHLVELHGGTVRAESAGPGTGASFSVILPIASERARAFERPPPLRLVAGANLSPPSDVEGIRVLVVDDEPDARELLAAVLTSRKAKVTTAGSASDALRKLEQDLPDVLVSDIGMPGEDGYSLIQRVRALPAERGGRTPAVALTAYARVEDRTRALVAGFNMHVPKPVEPAELLAVLASLAGVLARP
ncbi:MAG TPA: ATP-binding protein [Labilithrix sp.]